MTKQFFGTDGVRGRVNGAILTPANLIKLGQAAGRHFKTKHGRKPSVLIGKDTRLSGYMIEPSLVAGFTSVGMDVKLAGPIPTPGVSILTRSLRADIGVMITASHNPHQDNGIKLFGPDGLKLSDKDELSIERNMFQTLDLSAPDSLGRVTRYEDMGERYIEIVKASFPRKMSLKGLKIVIDCANGAGYQTAPKVLWELGADEVIAVGTTPNGTNINLDCGSTVPDLISRKVVEHKADLGIALDGDGDRLIMCDETGKVIDGDQLLALIGSSWKTTEQLSRPGVVATVMSNLGLERYLEDNAMHLVRTNVGDRHVSAHMRAEGYNVGGEQSGHLVMSDFAPTGDGMIAALQVLAQIVRTERPASELLNVFQPVPQLQRKVRYSNVSPLEHPVMQSAILDAQNDFGNSGRVLVRNSGTEPLMRIMTEGDDEVKVENIANELVDVAMKLAS